MKKPSDASSPSRLPDEPTFFLDRSLGKHVVAGALRDAGLSIEIHDDHFAGDEPDVNWLAETSRRNWVVLTKDERIRYNPAEKRAVLTTRAAVFVLTVKDMTAREMACAFLRATPRMRRVLKRRSRPFIAAVGRDGAVRLLLPDPGRDRTAPAP